MKDINKEKQSELIQQKVPIFVVEKKINLKTSLMSMVVCSLKLGTHITYEEHNLTKN